MSSIIELRQISPQIDTVVRCLLRIESKKPFTLSELNSNFDLQDIISVNLERAVQASVNIASMIISKSEHAAPLEMAQAFQVLENLKFLTPSTCIRMQKAVGFRNLLVHEYEKINWLVVYKITEGHLDDFKNFVKEILEKSE